VLLHRDDDLAESADGRLLNDAGAVGHVRDRLDEELAVQVVARLGVAVQALITLAALGRAAHEHAVADLHAADLVADRLDDAHARVTRSLRGFDVALPEHRASDRVTAAGSGSANEHLPGIDVAEPQILYRRRGAVADECPERPARDTSCCDGRRLNLRL